MTAVTLKNITKAYPGQKHPALSNLYLELASGKITALLGPSGCGKTTLLKLIAGLIYPEKGDVLFDNQSVLNLATNQRDTTLVFQNHLLFPYMTVAENVGFGLRMRKLAKKVIQEKVSHTLELVKLPNLEKRMPSELSGGQQQRVALARALVVNPKVLLLDEPLSNLDAHLRFEMRDLIVSLQNQTKVTCVFVTHDQQEAVEIADQIALIIDGRILQFGDPNEFYEQPKSVKVASFFGAQNIYECSCHDNKFTCVLGEFNSPRNLGNTRSHVCIRPENINIVKSPIANSIQVKVTAIDYLGTASRVRCLIKDSDKEIIVISNFDQTVGLSVNADIYLEIPNDKLWVMN